MSTRKVSFSQYTKLHDGTSNKNENFYFFVLRCLRNNFTLEDIITRMSDEDIKYCVKKTQDIVVRLQIRRLLLSLEEPEKSEEPDNFDPCWDTIYWNSLARSRQQKNIRISIIKNGSRDFCGLIDYVNYNKIKNIYELLKQAEEYIKSGFILLYS